jgi:hypothetical protein
LVAGSGSKVISGVYKVGGASVLLRAVTMQVPECAVLKSV